MTSDAAIEELIASPPALHWLDHKPQQWGIDSAVLQWLADHVRADWITLETGCGLSSVVFALRAARHTIVAPYDREHELVRSWCAERGFPTDHVRSMISVSQVALPTLDESDLLDLVLLDGSHAFPTPFLDWYYAAVHLRVGGYVVIDDLHIRTCRLLRDFLKSEEGRWRLEAELATAVVFEKLDEVVIPSNDWAGQPWCEEGLAARLIKRLRVMMQLRTRLRRIRARLLGAGSRHDAIDKSRQ